MKFAQKKEHFLVKKRGVLVDIILIFGYNRFIC